MNPRERVTLALNHKEPDRIAIDLGGSICSLIHKKAYIESCNTYLDQIGKYLQVLKKTYGEDIVFWGGGVDTQKILPFGTPEEVAEEVKQRIDDLAPGGGFVFAPVHNIQADVPPENIVATFETALEYGK